MKNQSNMTKTLLVAATQVPKSTTDKDNRHAATNVFLYKARYSSADVTPKRNVADKIDHLIKAEDRFPEHHPADLKKNGESTRFFFKHTNVPEAQEGLKGILETYTLHVLNRYCDEIKHPHMLKYLNKYPLGHEKPPIKDTRYYKNANKMVETQNQNDNLPEDGTVKDMSEPVLTELGHCHVDLQSKLYLCLATV